MGKAFAEIAEKSSPAVVGIKATKTVTQDPTFREWPFSEPFDPFEDDLFDYFFRRRAPRRSLPRPKSYQLAQGSGFIISADGYILTANHLVGEYEKLRVTSKVQKVMVKLADDREFEAKIIGTDPDSDVAVIKIDADNLPFLELADSDALEVGEWVLAIGNPFGLSHTVTAGIVSAKGRSGLQLLDITGLEDYIQTDAAINPGNSGGPLINLDGKVVGINTAIVTGHFAYRGNIGIGFAIPINMAKFVYNKVIKGEPIARGGLGIQIADLGPDSAELLGLDDTKGVIIEDVFEDSVAEKAGIKRYDVVVEFNGQPVETANELQKRVAELKPGTTVTIVVIRDGKRKTLKAELGERSAQLQGTKTPSETLEQLGLVVQNLTDDLAERLSYEGLSGVVVTQVEPGSIADFAGIRRGMLIMEVDRKPVKTTKDFNEAIEQAAKEGRKVLLLVNDGRYEHLLVLKLPKD
jgi:serine protease Do